ncbi:MAG: lysostaphin resistance A-like protein [Phycisphaerales bacterium]
MRPSSKNLSIEFRAIASILIISIWLIGILAPKLLWMNPTFRAAVSTLGIDAMFLFSPTCWAAATIVGWLATRTFVRFRGSEVTSLTLGLRVGWRRAAVGFLFGCSCTLPMAVLAIWCESTMVPRFIAYTTILPGFTEELLFRAFAFGMLVQAVRFRVWPAAIFTGVVFGLVHVDITPDVGQTILGQVFSFWIFMISLGGVLYAWLFHRAGWNLWIVIALHVSMNFWWDSFDMSSSPLGEMGTILVRVATVAIAITALEFAKGSLLRPAVLVPSGDDTH